MKYLLITLILLIASTFAYTQNDLDLKKAYTKEYSKALKKKNIVGMSLGIVEKNKTVHLQNFGFQDRENQLLARSQSEYKIGSISKIFTALAILKLYEEGKVDIEKSIKYYLPEIKIRSRFEDGNELLIKDILCHSSGLPSDILNGMFSANPKDFNWLVEKLNQQYMASPSNYYMSYSNLGYALLGELISRVSGKAYTNYMKEEIFLPLKMNTTYVFNGEESLSKAYVDGELYSPDRVRDQAAGSVVSSVDDMLRFITMLLNNGTVDGDKFLSKESVALLEKNHLEKNRLNSSTQYGLGVFLHPVLITDKEKSSADKFVEHGGDTYAYHASFGYFKNRELGGVVLTNSKRGGGVNSVFNLLSIYLNEKEDSEVKKEYPDNKMLSTNEESVLSSEDLKRNYVLANFKVEVEKAQKIKLNMGGQKINMKQKDKSSTYKVTPILLGFVPIPIKNIEMVFYPLGDDILISQNDLKSNRNEIVGIKMKASEVGDSWKSRIGDYKVIDASETSFKAMDLRNAVCRLQISEGSLQLSFTDGGILSDSYLQVHDDNYAYIMGVGRNSGYSLNKLSNGNLSFMGFELEKLK